MDFKSLNLELVHGEFGYLLLRHLVVWPDGTKKRVDLERPFTDERMKTFIGICQENEAAGRASEKAA